MCEPVKETAGSVAVNAVGTVFSVVGLVLGSLGASGLAVASAAVAMYLVATSSIVLAWILLGVTAVSSLGTIFLLVQLANRPNKRLRTRVTRASIEVTRNPLKIISSKPIQSIEAGPYLHIEPITQTAELIDRKEAVNER
jgi:hypothetical protein